jgi:hypothetical protein
MMVILIELMVMDKFVFDINSGLVYILPWVSCAIGIQTPFVTLRLKYEFALAYCMRNLY